MRFINPKTDFAFKKIFGSDQSHDILLSFLNGLLYDGKPAIASLDILNPYQAPRIRGMKDTYLDVKAKLNDGTSVIIEMQVLNVEGLEKRILYNAAKAYSTQLAVGNDYTLLNPVIALTITDFIMFEEIEGCRTCFVLKEKEFLINYPTHDLELVFVELPKFDQSLDELSTLMDQWLFFLKNATEFQEIPRAIAQVPAIQQAFEMANIANLEPEELEDLEHQEMFIHDQRNAIRLALRQGIEQGDRNAQRRIARELLMLRSDKILSDEAISQITGLTLTELEELRRDLLP